MSGHFKKKAVARLLPVKAEKMGLGVYMLDFERQFLAPLILEGLYILIDVALVDGRFHFPNVRKP